jgi:spore germination protein YaaH
MSEQEFYPYLDGFSDKQLDFIVARVSCNTDTDAFIKAGFCKTTYYDWSEDDRLKISNTIQQIKRHIAAKLINDMVEKIIENDAAQEKVIKDALDSADKNGFVYFIKQGEKVKIGYSKNVRDRLKQLQTSSPDKL